MKFQISQQRVQNQCVCQCVKPFVILVSLIYFIEPSARLLAFLMVGDASKKNDYQRM